MRIIYFLNIKKPFLVQNCAEKEDKFFLFNNTTVIVKQQYTNNLISSTINEIYLSDRTIEIFSLKFFRGLDFLVQI